MEERNQLVPLKEKNVRLSILQDWNKNKLIRASNAVLIENISEIGIKDRQIKNATKCNGHILDNFFFTYKQDSFQVAGTILFE